MIEVNRYFLELKENFYKEYSQELQSKFSIKLNTNKDFKINKFFYKNVGKKHYWRDRLVWSDKEWEKYLSNEKLKTWIMYDGNKPIGFYEQEFHQENNEVELINMGLLEEYRNQKLGSKLLIDAINKAFEFKPKRMWVHTCSLDHKNALYNYKSKGFKIFKEETINFVA